jgi:hypothetical protein
MKTVEHLSSHEKENLLVIYAKILSNFPGEVHVDPTSRDFNRKLIEGARYLAPFIYGVEEPGE